LRTRRPSGRLKPMDSAAALLAPGIRSPWPAVRGTATMLWDVRYDLADGGEYVAGGADLSRGRSAEPDERSAPAAMAAALRMRSRPLSSTRRSTRTRAKHAGRPFPLTRRKMPPFETGAAGVGSESAICRNLHGACRPGEVSLRSCCHL
jgi:hypothetical protein